jgi:hypothetical protein
MLVLASAITLSSDSRGTRDHILLFQIWDSQNLEDQVPVFISPMNRVTQLYPQALGSPFVSYDSQGYGEGIRTLLHTGYNFSTSSWFSLYSLGKHSKEDITSNNSSIVAWLFITSQTCLPCRCIAMDAFYGSPIPAFIRHVTAFNYVMTASFHILSNSLSINQPTVRCCIVKVKHSVIKYAVWFGIEHEVVCSELYGLDRQ